MFRNFFRIMGVKGEVWAPIFPGALWVQAWRIFDPLLTTLEEEEVWNPMATRHTWDMCMFHVFRFWRGCRGFICQMYYWNQLSCSMIRAKDCPWLCMVCYKFLTIPCFAWHTISKCRQIPVFPWNLHMFDPYMSNFLSMRLCHINRSCEVVTSSIRRWICCVCDDWIRGHRFVVKWQHLWKKVKYLNRMVSFANGFPPLNRFLHQTRCSSDFLFR